MSQTVIDQQQRQLAINPQQSFIVQAPAGSGKTALLVQRVLALLSQVDEPEEILAITFTRKAASEMRERVITALQEASHPMPEGDYQQVTWQLACEALEQDKKLEWNLLANPARLRVQTIDSLCSSLVRQMPLLSNFGATPAIAEDSLQLYKKAAINTIEELESDSDWSASIEHLVTHLDNRLDYLQDLICNMLAKRDQWLRHVADPEHPCIDRESLQSALSRLMNSMLEELQSVWPSQFNDEISELLDFSVAYLNQAREQAGKVTIVIDATFPEYELSALPAWKMIADLILTLDGDVRKSINIRQGFPAKGSIDTEPEKSRVVLMKQRMLDLLTELSNFPEALEKLQTIRHLPSPLYTEDEWQTMQALFELLRLSAAQLELVFREEGCIDYTAMSRAAIAALGEADQPTDLALALDYKISHILVDEFQDTSHSQFELLKRLTAGWQSGDQRTLFLVGDPMQSIYRFREAEVGLFLEAWDNGIGEVKLDTLRLQVNFRSQAGIIDWVNQCFSQIMPSIQNMETGAVSYARSEAFHELLSGDACKFYPYYNPQTTEESEQIVDIIHHARKENPSASIAILVRGRTHLSEIVAILKQTSLSFRAVEIEMLSHRPVIQDLLAIVKALSQPADKIAWLGLLRAPWCGLDLADIHSLCSCKKDKSIAEIILDPECMMAISHDGQLRLKRMSSILHAGLDNIYRKNMRDWIEGVWFSLGGPACLDNQTDLEDAEVFFQLLEKLDNVSLSERNLELARSVDKLFALPDVNADESLQIMTIHKSKGLEFDTVILPGLGYQPSNNDSDLMKWFERPRKPHGNDLLMAPIKQTGSEINQKYRLLSDFEKQKTFYENSRLLYVAATRARQSLHMMGHVRCTFTSKGARMSKPVSGSLLYNLWPVVGQLFEASFDEYVDRREGHLAAQQVLMANTTDNQLFRLPLTWRLPDAPEPCSLSSKKIVLEEEVIEFDWAGETARHIGTVVHELLQDLSHASTISIDINTQQYISKCQYLLLQHGVLQSDLEYAVDRVLESVRNCITDPRGQWILSDDHSDVHSEYSITGLSDNELQHVIIDRTFVDKNGTRWIIDYKTGAHSGADIEDYLDREVLRYSLQMQKYAKIIKQIDDRDIKLGLYFPLMRQWREWSYVE